MSGWCLVPFREWSSWAPLTSMDSTPSNVTAGRQEFDLDHLQVTWSSFWGAPQGNASRRLPR